MAQDPYATPALGVIPIIMHSDASQRHMFMRWHQHANHLSVHSMVHPVHANAAYYMTQAALQQRLCVTDKGQSGGPRTLAFVPILRRSGFKERVEPFTKHCAPTRGVVTKCHAGDGAKVTIRIMRC